MNVPTASSGPLRTAVDLFAGLGGNTHGASKAGLRVLVAANHDPVSVATHRLNHPDVEHLCQDLHQAEFHKWPAFDLLMASPCCQGHSNARGKDKTDHDKSRATAWAVVACADAKMPKAIMVENVPEFRQWRLYQGWLGCLATLGYRLSEQVLNAADLGVPQDRHRLFVIGVRADMSKDAVVVPAGNAAHVGVRSILDASARWHPITGRESIKGLRPLVPATLRRIERGTAEFGDHFVAPFYGSGSGLTGRSLDRPLGTVTTRERYAEIKPGFIRMLTPRECLRAQGFPAQYALAGGSLKKDMKMVGNACPPAFPAWIVNQLQVALA